MINYNGREYDGVLIHPIDEKIDDNVKQQEEFAKIVINTLLVDGKLIPSHEEKFNKYNVIKNEDGNFTIEITSINVKLNFLCFFVPIYYPSLDNVCKYNDIAQKMFKEGGLYGLKDRSIIENLLYIIENSVVFGENQFPTVIQKAAHIWYKIARFQAFNNGNKRTALLTTVIFLMTNQLFLDLDSSAVVDTMYDISTKIAAEKYTEEDIQKFILKHVKVDFNFMNIIFNNKINRNNRQ